MENVHDACRSVSNGSRDASRSGMASEELCRDPTQITLPLDARCQLQSRGGVHDPSLPFAPARGRRDCRRANSDATASANGPSAQDAWRHSIRAGRPGATPAGSVVVCPGRRLPDVARARGLQRGGRVARRRRVYLQAAIDMPGHGDDRRAGDPKVSPPGARASRREKTHRSLRRLAPDRPDSSRRPGLGRSRTRGRCRLIARRFLAIHAAAGERRSRYVVAFAPVSDLLAVREFNGWQTRSRPAPSTSCRSPRSSPDVPF